MGVQIFLKQHYVPQFLQKAWAGANGKVTTFRLDLPHISSSELAPEYTGYENDLWSLTKDEILGMKKDAVEKRVFGRIDSDASKVHQLLLNRGLTKLTTDQRSEWTRFLMSLKLREPAQVELLKLEASETLRHSLRDKPEEFQALAKDSNNPTLEDWTEAKFPGLISNFGINLIAGLVDDEKAATLFFEMKWWVWDFSRVKFDLILSDRPLILTGPLTKPETIVALPISPSKAFMGTQKEEIASLLRSQSQIVLATRLNESSLGQAVSRIIARNDEPGRFIENRHSRRQRFKQT